MKLTVPMAALAAILLFSPAEVRGQSALDGFDPNANGAIQVVVVQPDGKILIGGDFTMLQPNGAASATMRNRIARLNPDGTLDTAFNPNANNTVRAIVVQPDGQILVGGDFTLFGILPRIIRKHIARLDGTTGVPDKFDPNADAPVRAIGLQADGKILAGGDFITLSPNGGGMVTRNHIARLNPDGMLDTFFNPNANNTVRSIVVQPEGKTLIGGDFTTLSPNPSFPAVTRNRMARLNLEGFPESFDPDARGPVDAIAVQSDGKILAGGTFTSIGKQFRHFIARLDATTGAADSFNPNANNEVDAIAVQADGKILAGGAFTGIGGRPRNRLARLDAKTGLADLFDPNASGNVSSIAVQQDGKILAGGGFNGPGSIDGQPRNFVARLEIDGRLDQTITDRNLTGLFGGFSHVDAIAVQTDGKILIGGDFSTVLGVARNGVARLNTDGTLDMAFDPNTDGGAFCFAVDQNGRVLLGGSFGHVGGQPRQNIARVDGTTGAPDLFDPHANNTVEAIALDTNGNILVGGIFNVIGGQPRNLIARLDPTTGMADSFDAQAVGHGVDIPVDTVNSIIVQSQGGILVGGSFASIGGKMRNNIARLDPTTAMADSFNPSAHGGIDPFGGSTVEAIAPDTNGNILVGGFFRTIGGRIRNHVARLDQITGKADSFDPNVGGPIGNEAVHSIAVQADGKILIGGHFKTLSPNGGPTVLRNGLARLKPDGTPDAFDAFALDFSVFSGVFATGLESDGKILVGGFFTNIGGQPRRGFARLTNDTAALQSLIVTEGTVTLTRGGSSPQFTRVTFEISIGNENFTFLGNGTLSGGNWILTGVSLPTGQSFIIRARGFYRSGDDNGSESVTGTRQSAFFPGNFVIGDGNAVVGQHVVFWGAQWARSNSLRGGPAPASFKGFANSTSASPPDCGGTWMSEPGNSAAPPAGVPATINVIVASSITKSGNVISGNIPEMAVVQTDPGYGPNPGHAGTGTVVSVGCDQ